MYRKILLTIDISDEASWRKALPTAVALCEAFKAEMHLLNVTPELGSHVVESYFPPDFDEKMADEATTKLEQLAEDAIPDGIHLEIHTGAGTIYKEILHKAKDIGVDLIVMASHRPELSDYLLGPNAARVVRHADCSVMVVRG